MVQYRGSSIRTDMGARLTVQLGRLGGCADCEVETQTESERELGGGDDDVDSGDGYSWDLGVQIDSEGDTSVGSDRLGDRWGGRRQQEGGGEEKKDRRERQGRAHVEGERCSG